MISEDYLKLNEEGGSLEIKYQGVEGWKNLPPPLFKWNSPDEIRVEEDIKQHYT